MAEAKKQRVLVLVENKKKREDAATDEGTDKVLEKAVKKIVSDAKNMTQSPTDPSPSHPGEDNTMQASPNECIIL